MLAFSSCQDSDEQKNIDFFIRKSAISEVLLIEILMENVKLVRQ